MNCAGIPVPSPSTNLYRAYFERANLGCALTSPETGGLNVNPRLCEMLGYSASDLWEMTWADLTHPDDLQADVAQFSRLLEGEIDAYELAKCSIRHDGVVAGLSREIKNLLMGGVNYVEYAHDRSAPELATLQLGRCGRIGCHCPV